MFDGEIVKKKIPFKNNFEHRKFLVQDRVQDKVGLRKFSPKHFFLHLQKALKCHVWWRNCEKTIPFKKNFWSKTESKTRCKTKLDLENFHQKNFVVKILKMSCLMEKL